MTTERATAVRVYGWIFQALTPVWAWWLRRRLRSGKETAHGLNQRWMLEAPARPKGMLVWGHAVGVGEALALVGLLKRMHEQSPDLQFLITTTARTSSQALSQQLLGPAFRHAFAPVDTPVNVARFLDHWQPNLALWCEMDLWPSLIAATSVRRIPHALVNVRLDRRTANKRRWGRWLYQPLLRGFDAIWAQNVESAQHLRALGARDQQIVITGNIKAMAPPLAVNTTDLALWRSELRSRPLYVLASSHAEEETLVLKAFALLREQQPDALLVLVPRDPKRGPLLQGICAQDTPLRSKGQTLPSPGPYYIADTIGELGLWYRLARVAMVGGSWVPVGGHNPYEAVVLNRNVIHGPHVANFAESYQELQTAGLSVLAQGPEEIAAALLKAPVGSSPESNHTDPQTGQQAGRVNALLALMRAV